MRTSPATLLSQQPHGPYYLLGYSLGGRWRRESPHAYMPEERQLHSGASGCTAAGNAKLAGKGGQWVDPAVLAEIEREREAFLAAQQGNASEALFNAIEGNYADAVRLLTTAHSVPFAGHATLFVAERTLVPGSVLNAVGHRGYPVWMYIGRTARMLILSLPACLRR